MGCFTFLSVAVVCWGFCGTLFIPNKRIFRIGRRYEENSPTRHLLSSEDFFESSGIDKMYPRIRRYWNDDDNPDKREDKNGVWFGPRLGRTIQNGDALRSSWIVFNDYPSLSDEELGIPENMDYSYNI